MRITLALLFALTLLASCLRTKPTKTASTDKDYPIKLDTLTFHDTLRNRNIPVAFYQPDTDERIENQQVVIFSHGYGQNKGGDYLIYAYLTENLASKGYVVASIQHELPTDELLAMEGDPQITRRPNWERGAENIRYVLNELKERKPNLDYKHLTLIGHSNGGDMAVLFAHKHPALVYKIISLDNRRMPLPRVSSPIIYTLRSNDYPADEGVLPTEAEQETYGITVQFVPINHSSMDDDATPEEREIMNTYILEYLQNK